MYVGEIAKKQGQCDPAHYKKISIDTYYSHPSPTIRSIIIVCRFETATPVTKSPGFELPSVLFITVVNWPQAPSISPMNMRSAANSSIFLSAFNLLLAELPAPSPIIVPDSTDSSKKVNMASIVAAGKGFISEMLVRIPPSFCNHSQPFLPYRIPETPYIVPIYY